MNFHILTLFPDMVMNGLMTSITGRAVQQNKIGIEAVNIRDYTKDRHQRVDDYPYGGGAGMLMQAQPVYDACRSVLERLPEGRKRRVIYVTPQGEPFTQQKAKEFLESEELLLLCGHYEGIDERVLEEVVTDYISIGDYVLTGGELAAMVIVDAVARLVPGVLHNDISAETESFHGYLLEYPQYSRPESWHGKEVPPVLLSGNKREIETWRKKQAKERTRERRPDLYEKYCALEESKAFLMKQKLLHMDMIECINRGQAEVLYRSERELLLRERCSGVLYHAGAPENPDEWEAGQILLKEKQNGKLCLVLHGEQMVTCVEELLSLRVSLTCCQAVCTQREKLPVRGLYRQDTFTTVLGYQIRSLGEADGDAVLADYEGNMPKAYVRECIRKGSMKGAFLDGQLCGCIGMHEEGAIGLLYVQPDHRRRKLAQALETVMINEGLERGEIPYTQISADNQAAISLQEKLGLCRAKINLYWME